MFTKQERERLDRTPSITLQELWKAGLFHPEPFLDNPEFRIFAKSGKAFRDYVIKVDRSRECLVFIKQAKPAVKPIELEFTDYSDQALAYCASDGTPTDVLYCYKGRIVGPDAILAALRPKSPEAVFAETLARLEGRDGRGPARGKVRERLLNSLQDGPFWAEARVQTLLDRAARRAKRRKKASSSREPKGIDPLSTASGLARAEGVPPTPSDPLSWGAFEANLVRHGDARWGDRTSARQPLPGATPRGVLEEHPRLDVRTLAKAGHLQPGRRCRGTIDWSGHSPIIDGLRFIVDLTAGQSPHVQLEMMKEGEPRYQRLELAGKDQGGRQRWSFICPQTGAAGEVLALRDGRFASPRAQRLVHRSQIGKPRRRLATPGPKRRD